LNKYNKRIAFHFFALTIFLLVTLVLQAQSEPVARVPAPALSYTKTMQKVEELNKVQQYDSSLELLMEALSNQPDNLALRSAFKKTFALHVYRQMSLGYKRISDNKHDVEAYLSVARTYGLIGDNFRSLEVLTEGAIENPDSASLWMLIGYMELQEKREAEALSVYKEVLRIDAKNGRAHNSTADLLLRAQDERVRDLKLALHHAEEAVLLEPNNPIFIDTLAQVRFQMGEQKEAVALIRKAIYLAPNNESLKTQLTRFENNDESISSDLSGHSDLR
jgi:Flp pilus assembly protein TadD